MIVKTKINKRYVDYYLQISNIIVIINITNKIYRNSINDFNSVVNVILDI